MTKKNYSISIIRLLSFLMIIACHVCYCYDNELAWWLNIGVQVFLVISGFLYGNRESIDYKTFYSRAIPKVLVDYYVFLAFIIPVYLFLARIPITTKEAIQLLLGLGTSIPGLGHFWYISTILLCYIITPTVFRLIRPSVNWRGILILFLLVEILCAIIPGFTGAWINCYVIGVLIGSGFMRCTSRDSFFRRILFISVPCVFFLCGAEILVKYFYCVRLSGMTGKILNSVFHYGRVSLGITLFSSIMLLFQRRRISPLLPTQLLDWTDAHIYDAYIVHLFFILGPYSIFEGRKQPQEVLLGVLILLVVVMIAAIALHSLSSYIKRTISRKASLS